MNIMLTGATGFVGRQVLAALLEANANIYLVLREGANLQLYSEKKSIKAVYCSPNIFEESRKWWSKITEEIDVLIHVAWYAEPGKYLESEKNLECLTGTIRLAHGAALSGVKRFIGIGTCFEYDFSDGYLTTETPLLPKTLYAAAKASTYSTLSEWLPKQGIEFCWCRLFYLYGENEDERRLVPYLRSKLSAGEEAELTSGKQIRDFLDVKDAGKLIVKAALDETQGAINVCSGIPITIRQLAESIADEYKAKKLLKFGVRPDNLVDPPCIVGVKEN